MKIKPFSWLIFLLISSSCATVFNKNTTSIQFHSSVPTQVIFKSDTLKIQENEPEEVIVERSKAPLNFVGKIDTIGDEINIGAKNSPAYYWNILNYGVGMWVERNEPKRYTYPSNIYLDTLDGELTYRFKSPEKIGKLYMHLSMPYLNHFNFAPTGEPDRKINTGFLGLSGGLDYYHSKNQFLSLTGNVAIDFPIPFIAA